MIERGATLSNDLIIVAAKRFYDLTPRESSEKELHFSAGWVHGFKKRFDIRSFTRYGEDASADNSS
jgi:hypothetical protein